LLRTPTAAGDKPLLVPRVRGPVLCCAFACALLLAACGGSSAPSKAEYVAKVNAICKATAEKTAPLVKQLEGSATAILAGDSAKAREAAPVVEQLEKYGQESLAKVRAVQTPTGEKAAVERFLSPLTNVVSAANQAASSLHAGETTGAVSLLEQVQGDALQAVSAANAYGVSACGSVVNLSS